MSIMSLWLPIIVSSVIVWIASAIIWMVMPWHKKDWAGVANEEGARAALKGLEPGAYMLPHCTEPKQLEDPGMRQKFEEGPLVFMFVAPNGLPAMGGRMVKSFLYNLLVGVLCAYLLTRTAALGGDYLHVFRIAGTVAFLSYGVAYIQECIWFARPWSLTVRNFLDAFIYAVLTGGTFGWLAV